jgi:hypothetical protein
MTSWLPAWMHRGPRTFGVDELVVTVHPYRRVTFASPSVRTAALMTLAWRGSAYWELLGRLRGLGVPVWFTSTAADADDRTTVFVWPFHDAFVVAGRRRLKDGSLVPDQPVVKVALNRESLARALASALPGRTRETGIRHRGRSKEQLLEEVGRGSGRAPLIMVEGTANGWRAAIEGRRGAWVLTGPVTPSSLAELVWVAAGLDDRPAQDEPIARMGSRALRG